MPVRIGLCGRSGAGKGTVCGIFFEYGIPSIDTDAVYKQMTESVCDEKHLSPCMTELVHTFSKNILNGDLSLNRRALADIVFAPNGSESLKRLNAITHRHILARTEQKINELCAEGARAVIIDAPVLFESGYDKLCDVTVAVDAPDDILVERIMKRDGICRADAERRLASQLTREQLEERSDFLIVNNCDLTALRMRVRAVAEYILRRIPD